MDLKPAKMNIYPKDNEVTIKDAETGEAVFSHQFTDLNALPINVKPLGLTLIEMMAPFMEHRGYKVMGYRIY